MKIYKKGTIIKVEHILGMTAAALIDSYGTVLADCYLQGEKVNRKDPNHFYHLRQGRTYVAGKQLDIHNKNVRKWNRLRKIAHMQELPEVNIPGGNPPLHYTDELVIPDFNVSGAYWFIIKKSDVSKLLETMPLDEAGAKRKEEIKERKQNSIEEIQKNLYSPKSVLASIGDYLWSCEDGIRNTIEHKFPDKNRYELMKFTFIGWDEKKVSFALNTRRTDIMERVEPGILCNNNPVQSTIAAKLSPLMRDSVTKIYVDGWGKNICYVMPPKKSADIILTENRWLDIFDELSYTVNNSDEEKLMLFMITAKWISIKFYDLFGQEIAQNMYFVPELEEMLRTRYASMCHYHQLYSYQWD